MAGGALDIYSLPRPGPAIFEMEFETAEAARLYHPPGFVLEEVTLDDRYHGAALAGAGI